MEVVEVTPRQVLIALMTNNRALPSNGDSAMKAPVTGTPDQKSAAGPALVTSGRDTQRNGIGAGCLDAAD
jgi:hypothetical protein